MAVVNHALENVGETAHGADGDALARLADRWAQALGAELPALIGNERNSWSEAGTMPTDPATLASIATTTSGITGGIHPRVDQLLAVHVTRKHKARAWPARYRIGAYQRRKDEPRVIVSKHGRRNIRADVLKPNRAQGDKRAPYIWHDPVTETVRPRLRWDILELPAIGHDGETMFVGHRPMVARPPSAAQRNAANPYSVREAVSVEGDELAAVKATWAHAMRSEDPTGSWEWRAVNDIRGTLSISRPDGKGKRRFGIVANGLKVSGARTFRGLVNDLQRQVDSIAQA